MVVRQVLAVLVVCLSQHVKTNSVPFIEACYEGDNQCLLRSSSKALPVIAAGVPSIGINSLDPMHLGKVKTDGAGLKMEFRNTIITGLKNSHVIDLTRHGNHLELKLKCTLELKGDYTIAGKLLIMNIEGDGKYRIRIRDMVVRVQIDFGDRRSGSDKYWTIKKWSQTSHVETGASFRFQNLFNGNKELSDTIHRFANQNWKEIFEEVAPPIVQKTIEQIINEIGKLFDKVPLRDLVKN